MSGILIEGFNNLQGARTTINWVVAKQKRRGIGTKLILNCLDRARIEEKDMVALGVSKDNTAAIKLYERLGFVHGGDYDDGKMEVMGYFFDEE